MGEKVVLKIGSAVLMRDRDRLDRGAFCRLVDATAQAIQAGTRIVVVTSGAVATGRRKMGLLSKPSGVRSVPVLQALAALGQSTLIQMYESEFGHHDLKVAQLLLTRDDFNDRQRYVNARNALEAVLEFGAVPIINENDTVVTDAVRFGDNDQLAALVATLIGADRLVILSDIDGLYTSNPHADPDAVKLDRVQAADPSLDAMVSGTRSAGDGTGGMATKLGAARLAARSAIMTVVAPGKVPGVVADALSDAPQMGTLFLPEPGADRMAARKAWIGLSTSVAGRIWCDAGATRAMRQRGTSLLPSGITQVEGEFSEGDIVELVNPEGVAFGRGLALYPAVDMRRIQGAQSDAIETLLGYKGLDAVVHRNDFTLLGEG